MYAQEDWRAYFSFHQNDYILVCLLVYLCTIALHAKRRTFNKIGGGQGARKKAFGEVPAIYFVWLIRRKSSKMKFFSSCFGKDCSSLKSKAIAKCFPSLFS